MASPYVIPLYVPTETLLLEFKLISTTLSGTNESNQELTLSGKVRCRGRREIPNGKEVPPSKRQSQGKTDPLRSSRMRYPDVKQILPSHPSSNTPSNNETRTLKVISADIFDNISDDGVDLDEEHIFTHEEQIQEVANSRIKFDDCSRASEELTESETDFKMRRKCCPERSPSAVPSISSSKSARWRRLNQIVPYPRKPRQADYSCSICSEGYQCTVNENPWWAVYKHECPHCKQVQIPRIDISTTANAIELDPNVIALYGEGIEDSGDDDEEDGTDTINDGDSFNFQEDEDGWAECNKEFDSEDDSSISGISSPASLDPCCDGISKEEASKLLVLMCHARTCNGSHSSTKHEEICRSTKFLMLHIRDCKGTDGQGRECQFPWCKPCKKLLQHLSGCLDATHCNICRLLQSLPNLSSQGNPKENNESNQNNQSTSINNHN